MTSTVAALAPSALWFAASGASMALAQPRANDIQLETDLVLVLTP